jgi:hypothetical protein
MALDYTQALRKRSQLDAATDAAVIAAVRPAMLLQTDAVAKATAAAVFASTGNTLSGLTSVPTPTITDAGLQRTVTVSYKASSTNNFPILLGSAAWPIGDSSTAMASSAPNMSFYLLMDDSPSMAIGATLTDINNLITATAPAKQPAGSSQNCGFACHETNISHDDGTQDNLTIARNNNVTLRIALVVNAVNQLLNSWSNCPQSGVSGGLMQCMSALNNTAYKAALYTFDVGLNTLQTLTTPTTAGTKVSNIQLMPVAYQNCVIPVTGCNFDGRRAGRHFVVVSKYICAHVDLQQPGASLEYLATQSRERGRYCRRPRDVSVAGFHVLNSSQRQSDDHGDCRFPE